MTTAPATPVLKVARTATGYCLRVEGRGTLRESRSAVEFAAKPLETPGTTLVVDLGACDHLDSTFLGCLVEMQRRATRAGPGKFLVSAPPEKVRKLFGPTRLDAVLKFTVEEPQVTSEFISLPAADPASPDVMRHVMECHRLLAELGGPQQAAFAAIADHLERELKSNPQPGPRP